MDRSRSISREGEWGIPTSNGSSRQWVFRCESLSSLRNMIETFFLLTITINIFLFVSCISLLTLFYLKLEHMTWFQGVRLSSKYICITHYLIAFWYFQSVRFHARSWLPARSIVVECLSARKDIDPSGEIMVLKRFCPVSMLHVCVTHAFMFTSSNLNLFCNWRG